jgi:putative GTP pyrophosphokinase
MNAFTKGEIERLGEKIRSQASSIDEETLQSLQNYRTSHKETLSNVFTILCGLSRRITKTSIVTYRIKRFESIIGKLNRYPKMKFDRMWDIGGCRCILENDEQVYKLKHLISKSSDLIIRKEYDYIIKPQPEGYRSLHLFLSTPNSQVVIEVQLRNRIDHNWSTLVEITDLLFDAKLKEYSNDKELLRFHLLLSKKERLDNKEMKEIVKTIDDRKYFDKLSEVFARNYLQVRKQWMAIEGQNGHRYFLIETKKDEIPKITSFVTFYDAENSYFNLYKVNRSANIVLTHLPIPSYQHISIAYSNYILTFHSFLDDCYQIIELLLIDSLKEEKYWDYLKVFRIYNEIVITHIKNLATEMVEFGRIYSKSDSKTLSNRRSKHKRYKFNTKEKEWINDITKQISRRQSKAIKIKDIINTYTPNTFLSRIFFTQLTNFYFFFYERKLRRVLQKIREYPN